MRKLILIALMVACSPLPGIAGDTPAAFSEGATVKDIKMTPRTVSTAPDGGLTLPGANVGVAPVSPVTPIRSDPERTPPPPPPPPAKPTASETAKAPVAPVAPAKPATKIHKVVAGDSLWSLAAKYLGDGSKYQQIIELNKAKYPSLLKNPDLIIDGWELVVPGTPTTASAPTAPSDPSKPGTASGTSDSSAKPPAKPAIVELTTEQKKAKLQQAVNAFNAMLLSQNKTVQELNPSTIRLMIDRGVLKEEDWLAMNPPSGYRWALDGKTVTLAKGEATVATTPTPTPANPSQTTGQAPSGTTPVIPVQPPKPTPTQATPAPKPSPAPTQPAPSPAPAPKPAVAVGDAEQNYLSDLKKAGVPNILPQKDSAYYNALSKAMHNLPGDGITGSPLMPFYGGFQDIFMLEKRLSDAHALYIEKVKEGDTKSGWIIFGDSINSAKTKADEALVALKDAFKAFQPLYNEAKTKAQTAQKEIDSKSVEMNKAQAELDQLRAHPKPEDGDKITNLINQTKTLKAQIEDRQETVSSFQPLKGVFNL
ncbi:MAG: LysM peptidoglycan-binding domain-containing protein [Candidatus Ozemobacteraceae bacterium]